LISERRQTVKQTNVGLDKIDFQIITQLQQNSRLSFHRLANRTGVSIGTVFNRVKALESKGVLKGYTITLDSVKVGYELTAITLMQVEGGHLVETENEIAKTPHVVAVYELMGDYDAAIITKSRDIQELNIFIKTVLAHPYVRRTYTTIALNVIKEDPQISLLACQQK
jgi:Lrp/AsnC family transcriptional regulator, regulator for asnA, asnC and gidA